MNTPRFRRFFVSTFSLLIGLALSILLLTILSMPAYASGVTVSGTVYYSTSPLSNVKVNLISGTITAPPVFTTTTTISGKFAFSNVPTGNYDLKVFGPTTEYIGWSAFPLSVYEEDIQIFFYLPKNMTLTSPPQNSIVETTSPLFCWQGLPEATMYFFQLNKTSDWTLIDYGSNITKACYKTSHVLQNGIQYTWQIDAPDLYWHSVGTTPTPFKFTLNTTPITSTIDPGMGITVTSRDKSIRAVFSGDEVTQTVILTYARNNAPVLSGSLVSLNRSFYLTATLESSGLPARLVPGTSYTITVNYDDVEKGPIIENTLALYLWKDNKWVKEPGSVVDTVKNTVIARPNHFSLWAVLGKTKRLFLPLISR